MDVEEYVGALVFPARAGMNRSRARSRLPAHRVPRARGDEPAVERVAPLLRECSPRARG